MYSLRLIFLFYLFISLAIPAMGQYEVKDEKHTKWSNIQQKVEGANTLIQTRVVLVVEKIEKIQDYAQKAHTIVNGVVKNVQMVNQIIKTEQEIFEVVNKAIDKLNTPLPTDLGHLDLAVIDKWKHIQVLLAIGGQKDSVFELFKHTLEDDALVLDDKGRLNLIKQTYEDVQKIRMALRVEIRRINKQILNYTKKRREALLYANFFISS